MKIAIDKTVINKIKDFSNNEYIYIFENETLKDLQKLGIHCINNKAIKDLDVDINLTDYDIECIKKTNINYKDWDKLPEIKKNKFAIIVPNYNNDRGNYKGKTYLQNCIESILNQTYTNFELIIVDDMSIDTSVETVEKYVDKRIHLIKNNRKRYNGGSRNAGIDYAKTTNADYICFLDSDDWWIDNEVLESINRKLYNNEMMVLDSMMLFPGGNTAIHHNRIDNYSDIFFCINKVWCTCWSKVIRIDKIVYFCEDTLMEDRVWTYRQADNIDFDKIVCLNRVVYVWNRLNTDNSVSMVRNAIWNASAWCHIGHQLQFLEQLKHTEFKPILEKRIQECISKIKNKKYEQY